MTAPVPGSAAAGSAPAGWTIRPMRWWHIEALLPAEQLLFGLNGWTAQTFWSELAAPGRYYLVAESAAARTGPPTVLGYAGLMRSGSEADVQTLAVLPAAQGRGLGGRLLAELVDRAAGQGAGAVLLEVRADNAAAIALYRRFGFEQISLRRRYYQPGDVDALIMRLRPVRPTGLVRPPVASPGA